MIRLTLKNSNEALYVNPDHIVSIGRINGDAMVELITDIETDAVRHVTESTEEVARKVLEWRLAMIQYGARFQADANWTANKFLGKDDNYPFLDAAGVKRYIEHLAGLEETEHD